MALPSAPPPESDLLRARYGPERARSYVRHDQPEGPRFDYQRPYLLELELTGRCNLHCVHCSADVPLRREAPELSLDEILRVLRQGRALGIEELSLTGGEPLLHPKLLAVIDGAHELGFQVRLTTNGTLLEAPMVASLAQRGIRMVTVSLDGVEPAVHERIRGPGTHAPTVAGIDALRAAGIHVGILTAFSRLNLEQFEPLLAFCAQRRLNWQVQLTAARGRCPQDLVLSPREYQTLGGWTAQAACRGLPIHIIPADDLATPSLLHSGLFRGPCGAGAICIMVCRDGDVTPCSALLEPEHTVGNLRRESLLTICREERCRHALSWLRPDQLGGVCAGCSRVQHCEGGCPAVIRSMGTHEDENEYCHLRVEQAQILERLGHG
jgi:radical SAM protein with 4Fe4S-binding SPASM domain